MIRTASTSLTRDAYGTSWRNPHAFLELCYST